VRPQHGELLAEREVLECRLRAESQGGWNQREQPQDHDWGVSGPEAQQVNRINSAGILAKVNRLAWRVGPRTRNTDRMQTVCLKTVSRVAPGGTEQVPGKRKRGSLKPLLA